MVGTTGSRKLDDYSKKIGYRRAFRQLFISALKSEAQRRDKDFTVLADENDDEISIAYHDLLASLSFRFDEMICIVHDGDKKISGPLRYEAGRRIDTDPHKLIVQTIDGYKEFDMTSFFSNSLIPMLENKIDDEAVE